MFSPRIQYSSNSSYPFIDSTEKLESPEAPNNHTENEQVINDPPQTKINDEQINKISSEASLNIGYLTNRQVKETKGWNSTKLDERKKMDVEPYVPLSSTLKPLEFSGTQILQRSGNKFQGDWRGKANPEFKSRLNAPLNRSQSITRDESFQNLKPNPYKNTSGKILHLIQQGKAKECEKFLAEMLQGGFVPDIGFCNQLINMFIEAKNVREAWEVMAAIEQPKSSIKPNVKTYNTLMKVYLKDRYLTYMMKEKGVKSDAPNYDILKKDFQKNIDLIGECKNLYAIMQEAGIQPDVITFNTMFNIYGANGDLNDCLALLGEMRETIVKPDRFTYNTILRVCVKKGNLNDCEAILEDMRRENIPRNEATYTILMGYQADNGNLDGALALLKEMKEKGIEPDEVTYSLLIRLCLKKENFERCDELLKEMLPVILRSTARKDDYFRGLYNIVIKAYLDKGRSVSKVMQDMESARLNFDIDTFNILMKYYVEKENKQWVEALLLDMYRGNVQPNEVTFNMLTPFCEKYGNLKELSLFRKK